jgi:hypothetical protein
MIKTMLAFASFPTYNWNRHHVRLALICLKLLILLNYIHVPTAFAQSYSACSLACIDSQDTAFNIPMNTLYDDNANNQAICNNELYLKAQRNASTRNAASKISALQLAF